MACLPKPQHQFNLQVSVSVLHAVGEGKADALASIRRIFDCVQGALSSSSTLDQLQAFAKTTHQEQVNDQDLAWQVLYLALRAGHIDVALKVGLQRLLLLLLV